MGASHVCQSNKMSKKTVVITGGTKGIGLEIANAFLDAGYSVCIGSRTEPKTSMLKGDAMFVRTDVRDQKQVHNLIKLAINKYGSLDVLINNAGYSEWRSLEKISEEFILDIFKTNLFGAIWGCQAAASVMREGGSIINISSMAGKRGSSNNSAYVGTKFAMNGLTQALCKELGPRGIRVNGVCPVLISTQGLLDALNTEDSPAAGTTAEEFIENFSSFNAALGRMPRGEEVASMCLFLASESASAITGQNINIDCGVFPQ